MKRHELKIQQVAKVKPAVEVERGQIYRQGDSYYLVSKAVTENGQTYYNLTNLQDGNRWTSEMTMANLTKEIKNQGFELVNVSEIIIKEEV